MEKATSGVSLLPGALPSILIGVRYALGITWLTLIVAETIASDNGIGYMTMNAREFLQTDVMLLGILLYALLGKLADVLTLCWSVTCFVGTLLTGPPKMSAT